jgi:hypothetical protein
VNERPDFDPWVRLDCWRLPRRGAIVVLTPEHLFRADVPQREFLRAWSLASSGPDEALLFEAMLRVLIGAVADVPADATLRAVQYEARYDRTLVVVEHPSFDVVPEGTEFPHLPPKREREECSVAHLTGPCPGYHRGGS